MLKLILASVGLLLLQSGAMAFDKNSQAFLQKYCYDCHDEDVQKGDLDLSSLKFNPTDFGNYQKWIKVYDALSLGEMPPKKKKQPDESEKKQFLSSLKEPLVEADKIAQQEQGRTKARRLNRVEFEQTLSEILQVPLDIKAMLPEDAMGNGFDTVGEALNVSSVQIQAYLDAIDVALDKATTLYEKPEFKKYTLKYQQNMSLMQTYRRTGSYLIRDDGIVMFGSMKHAHLNSELGQYAVPYDGKYKVRLWAQSIRSDKPLTLTVRTGGRGHFETNDVPQTLMGYINAPVNELKEFSFENELVQGQVFRFYPSMLPFMRFTAESRPYGLGDWTGRQADYKGPGIHIKEVEVEGPIIEHWPPASHEILWAGVDTVDLTNAKPYKDPNNHLDSPPSLIAKPKLTKGAKKKKGGNPYYFDPNQKIRGEKVYRNAHKPEPFQPTKKLAPKNPKQDAARLIASFAPRAFRTDVSQEKINRYVELVHYWLDQGASFEESMRAGYKAILTSPDFLYHKPAFKDNREKGIISQIALSERLSYFLWSSKPDAKLLADAKAGKLNSPEVLESHVNRMLKDKRADQFIKNFLGQWLDLRNLDFTEPDSKLYPEFDPVLRWSMEEEVYAFFNELLNKNLSVKNVIDSNFVMVNDRLAKHYDLPAVDGVHLRKVKLPEESPRGGVLGMSAVHKVTANGAATSPVIRGVWILERIMGIHPPPPPPSVAGVEADSTGATTILEQLAEHRNNKSCSGCHMLIDPPGVALENFDVIGQWREKYRNLNVKKASERIKYVPNRPQPIVYDEGKAVVSAYTLKSGEKFKDINDFKAILLKDPEKIAHNVAEKLITFATGAGVSFSDRNDIHQIVLNSKKDDYGFRTLIHEIVKSRIFQRK